MGVSGSCQVSVGVSDEKPEIEFDGDAVRVRERREFYLANRKRTARKIGAVLLKVVRNKRPIFFAGIIVLNCLIEVSHHLIKIVLLEIVIERPDKILGFRLSD